MKVHVKLTKQDLLTNKSEVLADGMGLLNENQLSYFECGEDRVKHEVIFEEDRVFLRRKGEVLSESELLLKERGSAVMKSSYGNFYLDTATSKIEKKEGLWIVEYAVLQNEEIVLKQCLRFEVIPIC